MRERSYLITTKDNTEVYISIEDDVHTTRGYICINDNMTVSHRFSGYMDNEIIYKMVELANEEWGLYGVNLDANSIVEQIANEYDLWEQWEVA